MRQLFVALMVVCLLFPESLLATEPSTTLRHLTVRVMTVDKFGKKKPLPNVQVKLLVIGNSSITIDTGEAKIALPDSFKSGKKIQVWVNKEGWLIAAPEDGWTHVPDDLSELITIILREEKSYYFMYDDQIDKAFGNIKKKSRIDVTRPSGRNQFIWSINDRLPELKSSDQPLTSLPAGVMLLLTGGPATAVGSQEDSAHEAEELNQQVLELYRQGRYNEAIPFAQRALAINEKILGPERLVTATALSNLAVLYATTGAYAQAEPLFQRALAISEKALGSAHPDTAQSLNNLAGLYRTIGAYAKAAPLLQRALAINEEFRGPEHPATAQSLNNLAGLYRTIGAYAKAAPLLQRALAINEKVQGPEHPATAQSLNNMAGLYYATGAYAQAEPLYQRALAIREQALGPAHPETGAALSNLAGLYYATGAYAKAERLFQQALAINEKVLGPEHPDTATALNNLASLYYATGAYAQAEPLYQRVLAINEKVLGPEHPDTATALSNLAGLYNETRAYPQAEPLFQRALAIREQSLGLNHPKTAQSLKNLALFRWAVGEPGTALSMLDRAYRIETTNLTTFLLSSPDSHKRAYLEQLRGSTFEAVSLSVSSPSQQATALGFRSVLAVKGQVLDSMANSLGRLRQRVNEDEELFERVVAVAQQFSTLIYQGLGDLSPDAYRHRIDELAAQQAQLEAVLSTRSAAFRQEVTPVTVATIQATIPKHAALIEWYRYNPFDPKGKDEKTRWGKPHYVAYVLRHDGEPAVVELGEAEAIEHIIQNFRTALSDNTNTSVHEVGTDLYEKLVKPLNSLLGNATHLLMSPDGALSLIPFAALRDESGAFLSSKVEITYLTSGRDLLRASGTGVANNDAVVVANPDYGPLATSVARADSAMQFARSIDLARGGLTFTPLPGTETEAQAIASVLNVEKKDLFTQAQATESKVKQLHGPRILHIATHGFFLKDNKLPAAALRVGGFGQDQAPVPLGENPLLRSGLALAGANLRRSGEHEDGILTAAEVAEMDLRGTQLVVLSACETERGDVDKGEGVYALRRAFVLAGAETQVASLWKVGDEATKDLMVDYYQGLLKGEGRSAALRAAQLRMMTSRRHAHPYYWAAFVPIGHWTPLAQKR